jgi:hypothetical protein
VLCDRVGTIYKPLENVKVTLDVPSWLAPSSVFEISQDGVQDVAWQRDGSKVSMKLGTVNVSRFIVITSNEGLRADLQKLYEGKFAANVKALKQP